MTPERAADLNPGSGDCGLLACDQEAGQSDEHPRYPRGTSPYGSSEANGPQHPIRSRESRFEYFLEIETLVCRARTKSFSPRLTGEKPRPGIQKTGTSDFPNVMRVNNNHIHVNSETQSQRSPILQKLRVPTPATVQPTRGEYLKNADPPIMQRSNFQKNFTISLPKNPVLMHNIQQNVSTHEMGGIMRT